jgi:DNA-binding response OmpR family regulator
MFSQKLCLYSSLSCVPQCNSARLSLVLTFGVFMQTRRQQIALLHAHVEDVHLINRLLSDEPFDVVPHADSPNVIDEPVKSIVEADDTGPYGVVICARNDAHTPGVPTQQERVKEEITQLHGKCKRVLVLAESMDEHTVCSYLSAGAHHVIPLGDSPRLMRARIIAGLREHKEPVLNEWTVGQFQFDGSRRMVLVNGKSLGLSPREFEFAQFMFENKNRIIPTTEILQSVWSLPAHEDSRRIDTAACRLRKKMRLDFNGQWQLQKLRGRGFVLMQAEEG